MIQFDDRIGTGLYTVFEASLYGRLTPRKLSYWFFGPHRVMNPRFAAEGLLTFHELLSAMAIDRARRKRVPLPSIRQAIRRAKEDHGMDMPLARNHKLLWLSPNLYIQFPDQHVEQISGYPKGQRVLPITIPEDFMINLKFDEDGMSKTYSPFEYRGRSIIFDPTRQFGHPLVGASGYRADILSNAYDADGVEIVAESFDVQIDDVMAAVEYMKSLRTAA